MTPSTSPTKSRKYRDTKLARIFRVVMPHINEFGTTTALSSAHVMNWKKRVRGRVLKREQTRGLERWCIAMERHRVTGYLHMDMLLIYEKRLRNGPRHFNYLGKQCNVTRYTNRTFGQAVLRYNLKQDLAPLKNFAIDELIAAERAETKPYVLLRDQMFKDPHGFNPYAYILDCGLDEIFSKKQWSRTIGFVKKMQEQHCNRLHRDKPGFQPITRELIERQLTVDEIHKYGSWAGYARIVQYLNQVPKYGSCRPFKTLNLYLYGPPNIGKTSLIRKIEQCTSVYPIGVTKWFPKYRSGVYSVMAWNEFKLSTLPYTQMLQLLEGSTMGLEYKGGSSLKTGNPLVVMTSNIAPSTHIGLKFSVGSEMYGVAISNFSARVTSIWVNCGRTLFILQKLIVPIRGVQPETP